MTMQLLALHFLELCWFLISLMVAMRVCTQEWRLDVVLGCQEVNLNLDVFEDGVIFSNDEFD